jgi:hypothetical protein
MSSPFLFTQSIQALDTIHKKVDIIPLVIEKGVNVRKRRGR